MGLLKNLKSLFTSEAIKDSYFGEMGLIYDKVTGYNYLEMDVELTGVFSPTVLSIATKNKESSKQQQEAFQRISSYFPNVLQNVSDFLVQEKEYVTIDDLKKNYRVDSVTIPGNPIVNSSVVWEMDFLNTKDGFSRIVLEFTDDEPTDFSVEG